MFITQCKLFSMAQCQRTAPGAAGSAFRTGEEPRLPSLGKAPERALGGVAGKADPAVVQKAGKAVPALEHVADRLGDRGRARQAGTR